MFKLKDSCKTTFLPAQVGVGIQAGAESAIHTCRKFIKASHANPKILLKVDFSNAFNNIRRDVMLKELRKRNPEFYPMIYQAYSTGSNLLFGNEIILSLSGAQQGDVLGPYLFSLSIQNLIHDLKSELNVWYLDDGSLAGDPKLVLEDFKSIINYGKDLGLSLNTAKCEIFMMNALYEDNKLVIDEFKSLAPDIKFINPSDLTILGSPILEDSFIPTLSSKLSELKLMINRIKNLDSHDAFFLLKNVLAIPKILFFLRSAPLYTCQFLNEFDHAIKKGLEFICNIAINENIWMQLTLPVKFGGMGIRSFQKIALPAFIS